MWRGESFYNPYLKPLVEEMVERGIAEDSDGATVSFHNASLSSRVAAVETAFCH